MKRELPHDTEEGHTQKQPRTEKQPRFVLPPHVDYQLLSVMYPDLTQFLKPNSNTGRLNVLDFGNPDAVRALNKAILKVYFKLDIELPANSLCPSVPNRYRYVKWIADTFAPEFGPEQMVGLDIGTGASCIYPFLGIRVMQNCQFIGSDINQESLQVASSNIELNKLQSRIQTYLNKSHSVKIPLDEADFPHKKISFCMCNPPFYADKEERAKLEAMKDQAPVLKTDGKDDEFYTEGGELAFLMGLVDESLVLRDRVRWYTTMVGRKSTLVELRKRLKAEKSAVRIKEYKCTLGKTTRQFIAWSFVKSPFRQLTIRRDMEGAKQWVLDTAKELCLGVTLVENARVDLSATRVTWSRKARRQAMFQASSAEDAPKDPIVDFTARMNKLDDKRTRIDLFANTSFDLAHFETLYTHLLRRVTELA